MLFASIVLFTHCYLFFPNAPAWANDLASFAVDGFFVISGYLVLASYLNTKSASRYLRKRVLRIYPAYLAVIVLTSFGLAFIGNPAAGDYLRSLHPVSFLVKTLLFLTPTDFSRLPQFGGQPMAHTMDLSVWTLSYEFACYLMIIGLGAIGALRLRPSTAGLLVACVVLNAVQTAYFPQFYQTVRIHGHSIDKANQALRLVMYFLAGMAAYLYRDRIRYSWMAVGAAAIAFAASLPFAQSSLPANLVMPLAYTYLVLGFGSMPLGRLTRFAKHGDFSYGVYLYAWPVQKLAMYFWGAQLDAITLFVVVEAATLAAAYASWTFIERPAIRLKYAPPRSPAAGAEPAAT